MLKDLLVFWWDVHEPWINSPFFDGWVIPFAKLVWPAGVSYGITFELHRRKKTAYLPFIPLPGAIVLVICLFAWNFIGFRGNETLLCLLTWSIGWIAGVVLYELPSAIWNLKKKTH